MIGNELIPLNSYFIRILYWGIFFPLSGPIFYSKEENFGERAYSLMNEKAQKWKPNLEKWSPEDQEQFRDSTEYKEFLDEIFSIIENVEGTRLDDLYRRLLSTREENRTLIKRFYFNYYEIPLHNLLIKSVYEMYPMYKAKGDWISAYAITRYFYGMEKQYEYNLRDEFSWGEFMGHYYKIEVFYPWSVGFLIDPYIALLYAILISLFLSGITSYIISKRKS